MQQTEHRIPQIHLPGIRAVELKSSHTFSKHSHDEFGIGLILTGGHRSASGHGVVEAMRGDVITVSPGEVHDGAPLGDPTRQWAMLYFEPEHVASIIVGEDLGPIDTLEFEAPVVSSRRIAQLFSCFYGYATGRTKADDEPHVEEILISLFVCLLRGNRRHRGFENHGMLRAIELMNDDPSAPITLQDLADISKLSRYQIIRAISRQTGLTPFAYLRQKRLSKARRMVMDGIPISEAALAAGFSDQSHMTRAFKSAYAITPGALKAANI